MKKIIISVYLVFLILLIVGCDNNNYQTSQPLSQESNYKYTKTFWAGIDSMGTREYRVQLCNQKFAETYGNSNVECDIKNQMLNVDYSNEGKYGSIECECRY